jgi:hypothetical protein
MSTASILRERLGLKRRSFDTIENRHVASNGYQVCITREERTIRHAFQAPIRAPKKRPDALLILATEATRTISKASSIRRQDSPGSYYDA